MSRAAQQLKSVTRSPIVLAVILTRGLTLGMSAVTRCGDEHRGANLTVSSMRQKFLTVSSKTLLERGSPGLVSHSTGNRILSLSVLHQLLRTQFPPSKPPYETQRLPEV